MNEIASTGVKTVAQLRELAFESGLEVIDAAVGSPVDPPPSIVPRLLASSGVERGYPRSDGSPALKEAVLSWLSSSMGVDLDLHEVGATIGAKEFISTLPLILGRRRPGRDVLLIPGVAYPSYAHGAQWAGLEVYPMPVGPDGGPEFSAIPNTVAERALVAWVNSPNNPTGAIYDLAASVEFGERHGVIIVSDECYRDFGWTRVPPSLLEHGTSGRLTIFSLSKRSNLAGLRIGMYAGDGELVHEVVEARRELGLMPSGPVQAVAARVLGDEGHVLEQRRRYRERLELLARGLEKVLDKPIALPDGGIYLWIPAGDAYDQSGTELAKMLASKLGFVVAPGADYGDPRYIRVAATISSKQVETLFARFG